jgi:hypothetical protein
VRVGLPEQEERYILPVEVVVCIEMVVEAGQLESVAPIELNRGVIVDLSFDADTAELALDARLFEALHESGPYP